MAPDALSSTMLMLPHCSFASLLYPALFHACPRGRVACLSADVALSRLLFRPGHEDIQLIRDSNAASMHFHSLKHAFRPSHCTHAMPLDNYRRAWCDNVHASQLIPKMTDAVP